MSSLPQTDSLTQATEFLNLIHGSKPEELYAYVWYMERGRVGLSCFSADLDALAERCARWSESGKDVYFGCGLSQADNGPERRIRSVECAGISGLWADIDIRGAAHAARNLPESDVVIRGLLDALPVRPTAVVHSGHGLHVYWLFKETWTFEPGSAENRLAEAYQVALHAALGALSGVHGWSIDKRTDLASVLRVAGTANHKREPTPVRLLDWGTGVRSNPSDLERFLDVDAALRGLDQGAGAEDYAVDPNAKPLWNPAYWMERYLDLARRGVLSRHAAAIGFANQMRDDRQPVGSGREWMEKFRAGAPERDHEFSKKEGLEIVKWAWSKPPRQQLLAEPEPNAGIPEDLLDEAENADVENAPAVAVNGNGHHAGLGPIEWLNRQAVFFHRRIRIAKIVKVGRFLGDFDVILDDERRVCLGNASNVLSPGKVKAAFYDSLGVVLPPMKVASWDKYAHQIAAAAEIQDIAGDPEEEIRGWIFEYSNREMMQGRFDLNDPENLMKALHGLIGGQWAFWTTEGEIVVHVPKFTHWVRQFTNVPQSEIRKRLNRMGFRSERLAARDGEKVHHRRVFISPKGFDQGE